MESLVAQGDLEPTTKLSMILNFQSSGLHSLSVSLLTHQISVVYMSYQVSGILL